ncbi:MAG: hypothetical protein ACFCUX_05880 [Candidatus Methylacidiphilales bacterium]
MKSICLVWFRLLSFQIHPEEWKACGNHFLVAGMMVTWVAGIGRHWDDPRAEWIQQTGLGSVVYVLVLSALLWCVSKPLASGRMSYLSLLTYVSLTSPPALLYAIPLEKWMSLEHSNTINFWFLAVVSAWRVGLLWNFYRLSGLALFDRVLVTFLPLGFIVVTLFFLNLQHVVMNIMGGIRDADRTTHDQAYGLLFLMSALSVYLTPLLMLTWLGRLAFLYLKRTK